MTLTTCILLLAASAFGSSGERLLLNQATAEQFAALDGVDADAATSIVALRAERGRLSSVEQLRVLPLADSTLDALRSQTSVEIELQATSQKNYSNAEAVLAEFAHEPTIQQVQAWTNSYANTSPDKVRRWLSASRTFAALPQLTVEFKLRDDWDQGFDYLNAEGVSGSDANERLFAIVQDADQGQTQEYKVKARWDLDQLVMSSERIRIINEAQDIVKLRDKVLGEATSLYFERRRMQVETLLKPPSDTLGQVKAQLRLMEATANLDALTGGAFSAALARSGG